MAVLCISNIRTQILSWVMLNINLAGRHFLSSFLFGRGSGMVPISPNWNTGVGGVHLCIHHLGGGSYVAECVIKFFIFKQSLAALVSRVRV